MSKSLTYVEIDVDYCSLTYGVAPCKARLARTVTFDGANDYLTRGGGLTGAADSKMLTFSVWLQRTTGGSAYESIVTGTASLAGGDFRSRIELADGTEQFQFILHNAANSTICLLSTSAIPFGVPVHVLFSVDLSNPAKRHLYVNDVSDLAVGVYTNDTIDWTLADWAVGGWPDGGNRYAGAMSEVWFAPGVYIDFSVEANRRLFISSDLQAVSLGAAGATPTGTAPLIYLGNPPASWQTNLGTGGGFTLHGALTQSDVVFGTGDHKCFNTIATCQDRANFTNVPVTLRYAIDTDYLPADIEAIPNIKTVSYTSAILSLGKDLGQRATVKVTFKDHPHSDTGAGGDKYLTDRTYNPWDQGTFWGKFRTRQPFLQGRPLRLIRGVLGDNLVDMESRHFIMESCDGPSPDGEFTIIAKDVLKLADSDRAQAPHLNNGYLTADITNVATSLVLSPALIGSEYDISGYATIGGKEVVSFTRVGGIDANTLLLVHSDGNSPGVIVDASSFARTLTKVGNVTASNAQTKFGGGAMLFDGTGDYVTAPDSNDWTFAGDFTIDAWFRFVSVGTARPLWSHSTDSGNIYKLIIDAAGTLSFSLRSGGVTRITITTSTTQAINTWYHVAVVRSGNKWDIYVDGVSRATTTSFTTISNFTGTFRIGMDETGSTGHDGYIDEFRVSNVARWTTNFTPPTVAYGAPSDTLTIVRGQLGTTAIAHTAQERVQSVVRYLSQSPAVIVQDLLVNYALVDPSFVSIANWQTEVNTYLGMLYTATITEPTSVNALLAEIIEQAGLVVWWDALTQQVKLQVLHDLTTTVATFDGDNIMEGTLAVTEQPDKRVSRLWTYFNQLDPTRRLNEIENFGSTAELADDDAEEDYGSQAVKKFYSRWIPNGGRVIADKLNQVQLSRFRDPPRRFNFDLFRSEGQEVPLLGGGYQLSAWPLQDDTGAVTAVPIQVTRLSPEADRFKVEAEEVLFLSFGTSPDSPDLPNVIIFDVSQNNVNLRTVHDSLYGVPVSGDVVEGYINAAIIIGSTSIATPAFDVGTWPAGVTVTLTVNGRIEGHGGVGGTANKTSTISGTADNGGPGGPALYTRKTMTLKVSVSTGQIWGGGGGGGGAVGGYSVGGNGGAGQLPGLHTDGTGQNPAFVSSDGTTEAGGASFTDGSTFTIGAGGGPGLTGGSGSGTIASSSGGAPGSAIDGISFVTVTVGPGDRRGGEIN